MYRESGIAVYCGFRQYRPPLHRHKMTPILFTPAALKSGTSLWRCLLFNSEVRIVSVSYKMLLLAVQIDLFPEVDLF